MADKDEEPAVAQRAELTIEQNDAQSGGEARQCDWQHQALLTKEDDVTYNRAIADAHNAMADAFGLTDTDEKHGARAQAAIRRLYREAK